ncbi:MAG TPA: phospholipase D-like domain-containing protein [Acidimicrobiales bacterium]
MATRAARASTKPLEILFLSGRVGIGTDLTARLVEFIGATRTQLDCAIYDLRHPQVAAALTRIHRAGKKVRIAYDAGGSRPSGGIADPKPAGTADVVKKAGLLKVSTPLHQTGRHLMHHKFLVRDSDTVWTGSANLTVGGLERQDNNCLIARSTRLATLYTQTFNDLVSPPPAIAPPSPAAPVKVGGAALTVRFSPASGEGIEDAVVATLQNASSVRMMAFLVSDPGILGQLARFKDGGDIKGIYDPGGMKDAMRSKTLDRSQFWFLQDKARFAAAPSHAFNPAPGHEQDFMHNKVMIVDGKVITGSYNFSENAETNDENMLVIDSADVATAYTDYFDKLFAAYHK